MLTGTRAGDAHHAGECGYECRYCAAEDTTPDLPDIVTDVGALRRQVADAGLIIDEHRYGVDVKRDRGLFTATLANYDGQEDGTLVRAF